MENAKFEEFWLAAERRL